MSPALHPRRLLYCLVTLSLVTAAFSAPVASTLDDADDPRVEFATTGIAHEQRGDVAAIGVRLSGTDAATVRVGSPDERHLATVTVHDENGDGRATLRFNTYDGTFEARGEDAVSVRERSNASTPVASDDYDLELWAGNATGAEVTSVGQLVVSERSTHDLRTFVAPGSANLSNLTAVNAAMDAGNLTRSDAVTLDDTLVLELRASGLDGAVAAQNGSNVTAGFLSFLGGGVAELRIEQTNPMTEVRKAEIHLEPGDAGVVADAKNDSYYAVVDLSDANVTRGARAAELRAGHEYRANFTLAGSSVLAADGRESVVTNFTVVNSHEESTEGTTSTKRATSTLESPTSEDEATQTTNEPAETATNGDANSGADVPGFGVSAALTAFTTVALLAARRPKRKR
ncbi:MULTISPECIES: PGF-CTERM sorting domain-containing protein [Halorussus]|uniref:DUF7827 domain-containing protein n=1 Tax=Halorussus TaxID=1070314 RepID=UPI00209EF315|nr:PGF-CTERM sorting domain-containing protein [Halorussus vallis]USZ75298.1 PGF-CTERM sorting domain-containing protein [Halorussus vallis]